MRVFAIAICSIMPAAAVAAPGDCLSIASDLDRLACYDKEMGRAPTVTPVPVSSGAWSVNEGASKLTDQKTIVAALESDEVVNCGWNRGDKIRLILRCSEGKTVAYFNTGCHMTASQYNDYGVIEYRIDAEKAKKVNGDASTDNRALGLWSGSQAIPFIRSLIGKAKLVVRMTPYGESPFTATFSISGADEATKKLREVCNWK